MMKNFSFVGTLILLSLFLTSPGRAETVVAHFGVTQHPLTLVGTIQKFMRNTVDILDERDECVKTFVFINNKGGFKVGDRVRIYYYPSSLLIETMQKMTEVKYKKDGQNKGYIFKSR